MKIAYLLVLAAGVYLGFKFLLPISVPFIFGTAFAMIVVKLSRICRCSHKVFRILLTVILYGLLALLITLLTAKAVSGVESIIQWLPHVYENKLYPFVTFCYDWIGETVSQFDPALISALESLESGIISSLKTLISKSSGMAVGLISGIAKGVPSLIFSVLAMIFSTIFIVADYESIISFIRENIPPKHKAALEKIRCYLTDTLFVVIRSYVLIMLMTFTELSILFAVFGIENGIAKAAFIAVFDILPILGTGGIMIPWAVISLVLGYTKLGIELFIIYAIVTVVRNYMEPRIVGVQLGLHPIITLTSMFIGLRLFGFWGLFGLPVGISFFWKQKLEKEKAGSD